MLNAEIVEVADGGGAAGLTEAVEVHKGNVQAGKVVDRGLFQRSGSVKENYSLIETQGLLDTLQNQKVGQ